MEKPRISTTVTPLRIDEHQQSTQDTTSESQTVPYWEPGYVRRFPIVGFGALFVVWTCALASVVVLVLSNNKSSTQWTQRLQPSVILSAFTAIANFGLAIALVRGSAISWWRKAMHGATVGQLHDSWSQSASFMELLKQLFRLDTIGIAALAAKVAVLDGIFLQRATMSYVGQDPTASVAMLGVASTEFPSTGYVVEDGYGAQANCECFMIGDVFTPVVNNWETANGFFKGYNKFFQVCDGTCFTSIEAIGFEITCDKQVLQTNLAENALATYRSSSGSSANNSAWTNLPIFNSSFSVSFPNATQNYSTIDLSLLYFQSTDPYNPSSETCPGTLYTVNCAMRPALVTYPITITNYTNEHITNGVSLGIFNTDQTPDDDEILNAPATISSYSYSNRQAEGYTVGAYLYPKEQLLVNSTTYLGGIANAISQYLSSSAAITYTGAELWALKQQGTLAQTMMYGPPNMGSCDCSFKSDALDTIVSKVNELAFLTATGTIDYTTWNFPIQSKSSLSSILSPSEKPALTVNTSTTVRVAGIGQNTTTNFRSLAGTQEIRDVIHYKTDFLFMGLGVGLSIICVLLICPIYWKYWEIGRDVTLGPIEIAGAFGAPILIHKERPETGPNSPVVGEKTEAPPMSPVSPTNPNAPTIAFTDVNDLLGKVGGRKVTYGFVDVHDPALSSGSDAMLQSPTSPNLNRRSVLVFQHAEDPHVRPAAGFSSPPHSPRI